ncbi:2-succinylbenzoate--CoA ligase [Pullulanibacillus camelliae]|uniref:2-succinylbenzoate--CoA ligase n=1 Tax=Pullulanibacillus camelliae TaxID=1707096 RepID=A0A8J2YL30_9BACL|nr:o-succinylbenzoate--CoA ligase [Pullulanibacillus camelliae]GGE50007.1 2-succinylbenzoate--CoA ligase [Pullulanibacillus camelliae]
MENMIPLWLKQRAFLTPNRLAIETESRALTFQELDESARALALTLATYGITSDMKVALLQDNTVEMITSYHAISYLGAIAVPLNTRLSARELAWQVSDCEAALLLYDNAHQEKVNSIVLERSSFQVCNINTLDQLVVGEEHHYLKAEMRSDAPHTIIYTSGTTGHPKGVLLTYANHWGSAIGSVLNLGCTLEDKWLAVVPLFHVSGLSIIMRSVIYGMPLRLHRHFDAKAVNEAIIHHKVTMVSVVTAMLTKMVEELGDQRYPETFRCMLLGGGPVPEPLLKVCLDKNIPVYQTYGLSETASQIVTLSPEHMITKTGSAGKPLFSAQVKIVDEHGDRVAANQAGEIVVKGPNVTSGYYKREEATQQAIKNQWLHTGDMGYLDEEGFLFVLDRRKDLIVSGGENIYPAEIESVLLSHPEVEEAGVVGMKDEKWGRVPVAFVKLKNKAKITETDLQMFCRDALAKYKVPTRFYFMDSLPRNASGKLLRRELVKRLPSDFQ